MLSIFCILKVIRGSSIENTTAGGIWNYISLLYYPIALILFFTRDKIKIDLIFTSAFFYVLVALFSTFLNWGYRVDVSSIYNLLMIPYPILVMSVFYISSKKSEWCERIILVGYIVCLILNLRSVLSYNFTNAEEMMKSDIYFSLGLFPFALQLLKRKYFKVLIVLLQFAAVFLADKRTGLIAFIIGLILYILISSFCDNKGSFLKTVKSLIIATVAVLLFYKVGKYVDDTYNLDIFSRLMRLSDDGGSGRADIYSNVWQGFKNSDFIEKMFGHGMNTAGSIGGAGKAHNDFLQIIYDYGVFAVVFVTVFYISLVVRAFKMIKCKSPYAAAFTFSVVIGLFLAMFSYFVVYFTYVTCIMAFWGYTLSMEKQRVMERRRDE